MRRTESPHTIRLRCPAPRAFDFANLSQEYGRACTRSLQEHLRREPEALRGDALSPDDDPTRHLATVAAHFARRALGER